MEFFIGSQSGTVSKEWAASRAQGTNGRIRQCLIRREKHWMDYMLLSHKGLRTEKGLWL